MAEDSVRHPQPLFPEPVTFIFPVCALLRGDDARTVYCFLTFTADGTETIGSAGGSCDDSKHGRVGTCIAF